MCTVLKDGARQGVEKDIKIIETIFAYRVL
jgi:hypothetical protein